MSKYEEQFTLLSDREIHDLNRDIENSAELESAINEWFLNPIKYNESEIIQNINIENEKNNIFSMLTLALWYREGNHLPQSDYNYAKTLEKILTLKTNKLDSKELIHTLQNKKATNKNSSLYGEILGETSLQLGTYYSNSSKKSDLEKAKRLFLQSKWYAPLTVAIAIPVIGPAIGLVGGITTAIGVGSSIATTAAGALGVAGVMASSAIPIVGPAIAIGGLTTLGIAKYKKDKAKKKSILSKKQTKTPIKNEHKTFKKTETLSPEQIAMNAFGDSWDRLSKESQVSIKSAYNTYYHFINEKKEEIDFTCVIAPLGKALEGELKERFYNGYIQYLTENFQDPLKYKEYNKLSNVQFESRSSLLYITNKNCFFCDYKNHAKFTIGSFRYVLGIDKAGKTTSSKKTFCDKSVLDYTKTILYKDIFSEKTDEHIDIFLKELSDNVETLRKYRNDADHPGTILTVEDANKVLNIMIYTRKILIRLLNPLTPFAE